MLFMYLPIVSSALLQYMGAVLERRLMEVLRFALGSIYTVSAVPVRVPDCIYCTPDVMYAWV